MGALGMDTAGESTPTCIESMADTVCTVACGEHRSAVIDKESQLWTWGCDNFHVLGNTGLEAIRTGSHTTNWKPYPVSRFYDELLAYQRHSPVHARQRISSVSLGTEHALCISRDSCQLYAWGKACAALGLGDIGSCGNKDVELPVRVKTPEAIVDASAGRNHNICVGVSGRVYTFGSDHHGELGQGFHGWPKGLFWSNEHEFDVTEPTPTAEH